MIENLIKKFSDDKKFFSIVFFILLLIVLLGVLSPVLERNTKNNWESNHKEKIKDIQDGTREMFSGIQSLLVAKANILRDGLHNVYGPTDTIPQRQLYKIFAADFYKGYAVAVYDTSLNMIGWTDSYSISDFPQKINSLPFNQTLFYNYNLSTYLAKVDSIRVGKKLYYQIFAKLIEKHFSIDNKLISKVSLIETLSSKFQTEFEIEFYPDGRGSNDGRKYSFNLTNNCGQKIGVVTFNKPALNAELNNFSDKVDLYQSLLMAIAGIVIGFGFRKDFKSLKYRTIKLAVIIVYCVILRILFFEIGFPSNVLDGGIINPDNFSSAFGYGIVKSPIEFFITALFLLVIMVKTYQYYTNYSESSEPIVFPKAISYILSVVLILAFLFTTRAFAAIIRSVIFDSTLRYFKDPELIPEGSALLMNLNVLMIGFTIIVALVLFLRITLRVLYPKHLIDYKLFAKAAGVLLAVSFLFMLAQPNPLLNYYMVFFQVFMVSGLVYYIYYIKSSSNFNYVYMAIAGSILSITMLNYFNSSLEKESLKTIALELNRPNEQMLRFYIDKTLTENLNNKFLVESFVNGDENKNPAAFSIWSKSPLQKESVDFYVFVLDKHKKIQGYFSKSLQSRDQFDPILFSYSDDKAKIYESQLPDGQKIITGIIPVTKDFNVLGYAAVSVYFSGTKIKPEFIPEFLASSKNIYNDVLNSNNINVFSYENNKLKDSFGNLYLSKNQTDQILYTHFSELNESWVNLQVSGENYLCYVLKNPAPDRVNITAIALHEKQISLNLYNFFKLFIIHSLFIIALIVILIGYQFRRPYEIRMSFRAQLLTAFLFMSLLPILSLAIYNRHVVSEKSRSGILSELKERAELVENSVKIYQQRNEDTLLTDVFQKVSRDQKINYTVFENEKEIYSSFNELTSTGIFPNIMRPKVFYRLNNSGLREYSAPEMLDNYSYISFYKKLFFNDKEYIINVNSATNKINVSITSLDIDIFLFGVYSFATIIIIIISTLLANKISAPIRRLTKATSSVAHGDFNVKVENTAKGEVKELVNSFNLMTQELNKRQNELAELERETAWKEMARQVAHEIKNPLTPMKLAVQQLIIAFKDKHPSFDSIFEKVTSTVLNQIDTLNTIATEFSNFARMPNYKLEILDVLPVIKDTVNLFIDENIEISLNSYLESAVIEADHSQIRRMIINLIRNAIQADAAKLNINITETDGKFLISIADNGTGIDIDARDKIFDRNFTTKEKGMGLGLKLSRRFVESVGGKIYLKQTSSNGSEFVIELNKKV